MRCGEPREGGDRGRVSGLAGADEEKALAERHGVLRAGSAGDGAGRRRAGAAGGVEGWLLMGVPRFCGRGGPRSRRGA